MKSIDPNIISAIEKQNSNGKISINDLKIGDKIIVYTKKSEYHLNITEEGLDITSTNSKYAGPYKGKLVGTTVFPKSSMLSPKTLTTGGSLELWIEAMPTLPGVILTSEVKSISINGVKILPLNEILS